MTKRKTQNQMDSYKRCTNERRKIGAFSVIVHPYVGKQFNDDECRKKLGRCVMLIQ